jgi:hypothetical protein
MTKWVGEAWEKLHRDHKDAIIDTFKNVGLSLPTDGSKDHELSIRDLLNITVGDYTRIPKAFKENPIIIPNDISNTIEVDNEDEGYLYAAQEVEEGIAVKVEDEDEDEDEDDITTNSGEESDQQFDYDSESSFDDSVNGDEDEQDKDME